MNYYVYILTNQHHTVTYIGVTRDLIRRIYEHKNHLDKGSFTDIYNIDKLIYYEYTSSATAAIEREKQLKGWTRLKKKRLIDSMNPEWKDLYESIL